MNKEWGRGPTDCEFRIGLRKLLCSGAIRILCANIDKLRAAAAQELREFHSSSNAPVYNW